MYFGSTLLKYHTSTCTLEVQVFPKYLTNLKYNLPSHAMCMVHCPADSHDCEDKAHKLAQEGHEAYKKLQVSIHCRTVAACSGCRCNCTEV